MSAIELKLTDADRVALKEVLDLIIPAIDHLPGAGEMGLAPEVEELATRFPRYGEALQLVMEALSLDPSVRAEGGFLALDAERQTDALQAIEAHMPSHFNQLVNVVYVAYYNDARVEKRIGWRGGALQPLGWEMEPWDPAILDTVAKRPPFWRKP